MWWGWLERSYSLRNTAKSDANILPPFLSSGNPVQLLYKSFPMSTENERSTKAASSPADSSSLVSKEPVHTDTPGDLEKPGSDVGKPSRKPILDSAQEKAAQLEIRPPVVTGGPGYARPSNLRRSSHALQLFGVLFVIMLIMFGALLAGLYSFYAGKVEPALRFQATAPAPTPAPAVPSVPVAVKIDVPQEFKDQLGVASEKITELQKQIDFLRDANGVVDSRLKEVTERLSKPAPAPVQPTPVEPTAAVDGKPEVAAVVPLKSSSNQELVLLKERNRLTAYADEAIANGTRKPLSLLIERLQDPEMANLRHAAYAEVQRIYYHLRFTSRIDPNFRIPVNEMFKDSAIRDESDLKTDQIIKLLHDSKKPWEVRLRAAWLLGGRRTREVGEALIKAIKEDEMLDVAKEAQLSFEQNMEHKFLLLDIPAIEAWWKTQTELGKTDGGDEAAAPKAGEPNLPKK